MIFWVVVAIGLCWAFYAGAMSVWQYFQVSWSVDEAFEQRSVGQSYDTRLVRDHILRVTNEADVPLTERDVNVQLVGDQVVVEVVWSFPVLTFKGEVVLAVPLSVKRQRGQGEMKVTPYR
ncbi:MAG: hypothetical protein ACRELS_18705 [Candidatus Rokuibacteriota bacterium]